MGTVAQARRATSRGAGARHLSSAVVSKAQRDPPALAPQILMQRSYVKRLFATAA